MTKITLHIYGGYLHCCTHIAAVVEDSKGQNPPFKIGEQRPAEGYSMSIVDGQTGEVRVIDSENSTELELGEGRTMTLYSSKSFAYIQAAFNQKYPEGPDSPYNYVANNCADQVNFVLDKMFPANENKLSSCLFLTKKTVASCLAIPALGSTCVPAPLFINTPQGVFEKATFLAKSHGESTSTPLLQAAEALSTSPKSQSMQ